MWRWWRPSPISAKGRKFAGRRMATEKRRLREVASDEPWVVAVVAVVVAAAVAAVAIDDTGKLRAGLAAPPARLPPPRLPTRRKPKAP